MAATLIAIEGIDGVGKGTQSQLLRARLVDQGKRVRYIYNPTDGPLGPGIRLLLSEPINLNPVGLMLAFIANNQLIDDRIVRTKDEFDYVILDRFWLSTMVYQADVEGIDVLPRFNFVIPHLVVYLTADPRVTKARIANSGKPLEHFERKGEDYFRGLDEHYRSLLPRFEHVIVNAEVSATEVHRTIWQILSEKELVE